MQSNELAHTLITVSLLQPDALYVNQVVLQGRACEMHHIYVRLDRNSHLDVCQERVTVVHKLAGGASGCATFSSTSKGRSAKGGHIQLVASLSTGVRAQEKAGMGWSFCSARFFFVSVPQSRQIEREKNHTRKLAVCVCVCVLERERQRERERERERDKPCRRFAFRCPITARYARPARCIRRRYASRKLENSLVGRGFVRRINAGSVLCDGTLCSHSDLFLEEGL